MTWDTSIDACFRWKLQKPIDDVHFGIGQILLPLTTTYDFIWRHWAKIHQYHAKFFFIHDGFQHVYG